MIEFAVAAAESENPVVETSLVERWSNLPGVSKARLDGEHYQLSVSEPHSVLPTLITLLQAANLRLISLTTRHASLEDVFVNLAGRSIEQAEQEKDEQN